MVAIKSVALLALSASIATAIPQYRHARLHHRNLGTAVDLTPLPTGAVPEPHHHHHHNETEDGVTGSSIHHDSPDMQKPNINAAVVDHQASSCSDSSTHTEYVTSTNVVTVTAQKRWDYTRTWTWTGNQYTSAAAPAATYATAGTAPAYTGSDASATAAASSAASSAAAGGSSASSGGKKGLAYNTLSLLTQFNGAAWSYNWAASAGGTTPSGVEYVPMLWGTSGIGAWAGQVQTAITNGATHVLSFNEPDFPTQANIPAAQAAQLHITNVASLSGKVKIVSPAITNSNIGGQGLDWMTQFLAACGGTANNCKLDAVAFHWYNNPGTIDDFKSHATSVINLAQKNGISKVWLTEFGLNSGSSDEQVTFLQQAIPWLESQPAVERYAYFMVGNGDMTTNNLINVVGKAYIA